MYLRVETLEDMVDGISERCRTAYHNSAEDWESMEQLRYWFLDYVKLKKETDWLRVALKVSPWNGTYDSQC